VVDVGKLTLDVIRDGYSVSATGVLSTRPMAAQILKGKTPAQVLQIVPLLFSVCGRAQGSAASAALQAAQQGSSTVSAEVERTIVCEAMQEHLWRVMLDWPKLLGLPQQEQRFTAWYSMLRKVGTGETDMSVFLHEFERDGLGMPLAEWRALHSYHALQIWFSKAHSPVAQLLSKLAGLKHTRPGPNEVNLLPAWSAAEAQKACAGKWNAAFSARPDWLGNAAETGAWAYFADNKLLRDVWQQTGSKVLVRLLARVMDVAEMADGRAATRLDVASPAAGEGIAVVRTARGLLMHHVCLAAETVKEYEIVAPTEWNFHPDGAFAQDMRGLVEMEAGHLQQMAHIEVLSLDPCVAYEVELKDA
jgi:hypothetical protein